MPFLFMKPRIMVRKQSREAKDILERINAYLESQTEEPAELLVRFWKAQGVAFTYQEIREVLMAEKVPQALTKQWQQDYSKLVTGSMASKWKEAMSAGSKESEMARRLNGFEFDMTNHRIQMWIEKHGAEFVTNSTLEQKEAIKIFLHQSVREKMGTDELARLIRPCVGLTKPQTAANIRHYNTVKETLMKEHPRMKAEAVEKKAREASFKYAEKQHRQRAYTIAQTEMARAYNQGIEESVKQAQENGLMGTMKRAWITSGDDKVCALCNSLNGMEISMEDEFDSLFGTGKGKIPLKLKNSMFQHTQVPPAHPRCACAVSYVEIEPSAIKPVGAISSNETEREYLVQGHTPGEDISDGEKLVGEVIAEMPEKVQNALKSGTVIDIGKIGASQYDYINDILYIAKGAEKGDIIHEIGHLVENKLMDLSIIKEMKKNFIENVPANDIVVETYYDTAGKPREIFLLKNSQFVSDYQGRLYVNDWSQIYDENWNIRTELLQEFISEPFRKFMENPEKFRTKYPEFYKVIKEAVE